MEGRGWMGGWGSAEVWAKHGKFYSHVGTETMVCSRGIRDPHNLLAVHQISLALTCGLEGVGKLIVRDLKSCLAYLKYQREEHIATVIASHGLTDQAWNFTPRRRYRAEGNWAWRMWIKGRPIS